MNISTLSTFPEMFDSVMENSIMKRAQDKGILQFSALNLRDWTHDKHKTTDDDPYGGGSGLVMKCEPIFEAFDDICKKSNSKPYVILLGPTGRQLTDSVVNELTNQDNLLFICGHYEGIDQRVYSLADDVISIGDYVLTSGELASMVVIDAVVRKLPGVLGADNGAIDESFTDSLLEHPQYTRPSEYRAMKVPDVLLSGNHQNVADWKRAMSLLRTKYLRSDIFNSAKLSKKDYNLILEYEEQYKHTIIEDKTGYE